MASVPKRLTPIFRDRHELAAADDLGDGDPGGAGGFAIPGRALLARGRESRWTNEEIEASSASAPTAASSRRSSTASRSPATSLDAKRKNASRRRCASNMIVAGGRPPSALSRSPPTFGAIRDGRRMGFLKMVAGMLGVGLDDLVQREPTPAAATARSYCRRPRWPEWLSPAAWPSPRSRRATRPAISGARPRGWSASCSAT